MTPDVNAMNNGPDNFDSNAEFCPSCGVRWWDKPIPDSHWRDGAKPGYPTHYSNIIGIYDRGRDRTVEWMCPSCKTRWERA